MEETLDLLPEVITEPGPFLGWVKRPDAQGRMGWEKPDLTEEKRLWAWPSSAAIVARLAAVDGGLAAPEGAR